MTKIAPPPAEQTPTEADAQAALGRISTTTDLGDAAEADIVVEAVFEQLEVKQEIFRALDKICKPGALLATNTSASGTSSAVSCPTSRTRGWPATASSPGRALGCAVTRTFPSPLAASVSIHAATRSA